MATMQDLANAQQTDAAAVAADVVAVTTATTALTNAQHTEATDATAFAAALQTTGPIALAATDNLSVNIYSPASGTPGFTVVNYPFAVNVPVPVPPPAPTPIVPAVPIVASDEPRVGF